MPVTRKTQILAKIEPREGINSAPVAADAVQVYEASLTEGPYDIPDRRPAGSSMSREVQPPGRGQRQLSYQCDFEGSGTVGTSPPWGKLVRGCGVREIDKYKLTTTAGGVTGAGLQIGELIRVGSSGSGRRGVVLQPVSGSGAKTIYVAWFEGAIPVNNDAMTGESSASTVTLAAASAVNIEGKAYRPDSERWITVTGLSSWTGTAPALGDVLLFTTGSPAVTVGAGQWVADNGGGSYEIALHWGDVLAGYGAVSPLAGTATVATVTASRTPSLTHAYNRDGLLRYLVGSRGSFELSGAAGHHMMFNFTFVGLPSAHGDVLLLTGVNYGTILAPRLIGAIAGFGVGSQFLPLPVRSVSLNLQGRTVPKPDANAPTGDKYVHFSDRDPRLVVEIDQVGKTTFDPITYLIAGTDIRFGLNLGTVAGNIMAVAANQCQVMEIGEGDADGIATHVVTLAPRQINAAGDDEFFLAQI